MFAIVDIAGQQFKIEKDQKLYVHRLDGEAGSDIFLDRVLLIDTDKNVIVGNPVISDAVISAKILSHVKGDKIKIFKKKRRKAYQILKGHRQLLTEIQVSEIFEKGGSKAIKEASSKKTVKENVQETAVEKEIAKKPEKKEAVKSEKTTGKTPGKAKTALRKRVSESKTRESKSPDSSKGKTPSAKKSTKRKPGTAQKTSSKKTDKPQKK
jgi:large subunit ribosomal protein L21